MPHLHLHTHFSFGIGVSSPDVLAAAAAERGFAELACTDTNGVYGAVEFQRACEAAGVRPIFGAHLVAGDEETVALATDERGWAALCRAVTRIHWKDGRMVGRSDGQVVPDITDRPTVRPSDRLLLSTSLAKDREGLVLLSRDPAFLERVLRR
ncbi:MAG: PHP domain-containing protein, partial [Gemmatimonadales bacterium]